MLLATDMGEVRLRLPHRRNGAPCWVIASSSPDSLLAAKTSLQKLCAVMTTAHCTQDELLPVGAWHRTSHLTRPISK